MRARERQEESWFVRVKETGSPMLAWESSSSGCQGQPRSGGGEHWQGVTVSPAFWKAEAEGSGETPVLGNSVLALSRPSLPRNQKQRNAT